jgi:hypothetical protein
VRAYFQNVGLQYTGIRLIFAAYNVTNVLIAASFLKQDVLLSYLIILPVTLSFLDFGITASSVRGFFVRDGRFNAFVILIAGLSALTAMIYINLRYDSTLLSVDMFLFYLYAQSNNILFNYKDGLSVNFIVISIFLRLISFLLFFYQVLFSDLTLEEFLNIRIFSHGLIIISVIIYLFKKGWFFSLDRFGFSIKIYVVSLIAFLIENFLRLRFEEDSIYSVALITTYLGMCSTLASIITNSYYHELYPIIKKNHFFYLFFAGALMSFIFLIISYYYKVEFNIFAVLSILVIFVYKHASNIVGYDLNNGPRNLLLSLFFSAFLIFCTYLVLGNMYLAQLVGLLASISFGIIYLFKNESLYR